MLRPLPSPGRRNKIDAVTQIVKRVCGLSQTESFNIAKEACIFSAAKRYAGGKFAGKET